MYYTIIEDIRNNLSDNELSMQRIEDELRDKFEKVGLDIGDYIEIAVENRVDSAELADNPSAVEFEDANIRSDLDDTFRDALEERVAEIVEENALELRVALRDGLTDAVAQFDFVQLFHRTNPETGEAYTEKKVDPVCSTARANAAIAAAEDAIHTYKMRVQELEREASKELAEELGVELA